MEIYALKKVTTTMMSKSRWMRYDILIFFLFKCSVVNNYGVAKYIISQRKNFESGLQMQHTYHVNDIDFNNKRFHMYSSFPIFHM